MVTGAEDLSLRLLCKSAGDIEAYSTKGKIQYRRCRHRFNVRGEVEPENNNNQLYPYLVEPKEAGRLLGISRSQFLALDKDGRLGPQAVNLGYGAKRQCRRWNTDELSRWVSSGCPSRREWVEREKINQKMC